MSNETKAATNQYLTFSLDQEIYAMEIDTVKEVLELTRITKVPRTPDSMRGVINLRGHAVPVFDLRTKFHLPEAEDTVDTCIIILDVEQNDETLTIGALVDSVSEVIEIKPESIEPVPAMGLSLDNRFVKGMGRRDEDFVIILDSLKIFDPEELNVAQES
ncbi:chemotaxis protein CheW [Desulfoplanes sp.]